ncbi:MAG: EamA family transporter [Defluviitaleaceae bacterium]|nr:EamA family transporter [Defluviitaleaceae bacterium]
MELWLLYAAGAAIFAALTSILAKIGIKNVNSHLATAIRTMVVLVFAWLMVFIAGSWDGILHIQGRTWVFLVLSGLATGGSWLCFFRALKLGNVNKVAPLKKSSTILTMVLAFVILGEPMGIATIIGMALMGIGTWLMLELKKGVKDESSGKGWLLYALLAAVFASLVAIFGKIGVADMDPNLWTAIRTVVVVPLSWLMVFVGQKQSAAQDTDENRFYQKRQQKLPMVWAAIKAVDAKSWTFLVLSGVATGVSWLFFYHALKIGNASLVVPIDRLSIIVTMGFARLVLGERFSWRSIAGLLVLVAGTLLLVVL